MSPSESAKLNGSPPLSRVFGGAVLVLLMCIRTDGELVELELTRHLAGGASIQAQPIRRPYECTSREPAPRRQIPVTAGGIRSVSRFQMATFRIAGAKTLLLSSWTKSRLLPSDLS